MIAAVPPGVLAALTLIALLAGIGTTALGPGGVLTTVGLFTLTGLPAAAVAGTAIAAQIATGLVATGACVRSGHLRAAPTRRTAAVFAGAAAVFAGAAAVGTPLGVLLGTRVDQRAFGFVLAAVTLAAALGLAHRLRADAGGLRATAPPRPVAVGALGVAVAVVSGTVGVGGPLLAVSLLIALGAPTRPLQYALVLALVAVAGYLAATA